jgi:ATP:ADP antiporter, AAA family
MSHADSNCNVSSAAAPVGGPTDVSIGRLWPISRLRHGEARPMALFSCYAFILLVCYYVLKTLREPLLLSSGSVELKSYAHGLIALLLVVLVPLHGLLFRHFGGRRLLHGVTGFAAITLMGFAYLGRAGANIGFAYYVWVGIFGLAMIAQFWAHAAHVFGVEQGQRLFPIIAAGAAAGALLGPLLYSPSFSLLGAWNLMLIVAVFLLATPPLIHSLRPIGGPPVQAGSKPARPRRGHLLGGFETVLNDRYLVLLAALAVLLNWVNTTGEYILAELVVRHVDQQLASQPSLGRDVLIGSFYADYYFVVNVAALLLQVLLVRRIFNQIGVAGALLILPSIALVGYGATAFVPIFSIVCVVKALENSTDYSLMNTARHALYLPLSEDQKYAGKTAIDTFFWRLGDLVQAAGIYIGINLLGFGIKEFAVGNMILALIWLYLAVEIGRRYRSQTKSESTINWSRLAAGVAAAALACIVFVPTAAASALFADDQPLELELRVDMRKLCRNPGRKSCEDAPAVLVYTSEDGIEHRVDAEVRSRGRWREDTGNCALPALFVFLRESGTHGTIFDGQSTLPLTTHCQWKPAVYEHYVLKEYLAYRLYNALTTRSLRVRLARISYVDAHRPTKTRPRYGFFTEHFDELAARHNAQVWKPDKFDPALADPAGLRTLELFQYMIGNTDWSIVYRHNIELFLDERARPFAVPYDFDFSGFVNTGYAGPAPTLPIRTVRQRLFRGGCQHDEHWVSLFSYFIDRRPELQALVTHGPGLNSRHREEAGAYLEQFFAIARSPEARRESIIAACRAMVSADSR